MAQTVVAVIMLPDDVVVDVQCGVARQEAAPMDLALFVERVVVVVDAPTKVVEPWLAVKHLHQAWQRLLVAQLELAVVQTTPFVAAAVACSYSS